MENRCDSPKPGFAARASVGFVFHVSIAFSRGYRAPEKDNFHALSLNRISAKQSPGVRGPDNAHEIDYRSVYRLLTFWTINRHLCGDVR